MRSFLLLTMLSAALLLAGCPKHNEVKEPPPATTEGGGATTSGAGGGVGEGRAVADDAAAREAARLNERIIYFDFDNADIRPEFRDTIAAHAKRLAGSAAMKVRLEGHTDERGSREYNIGLGERRAQSVRRALMLLGVGEAQITTVSYGEERPAVQGDDESAWAKNRRVEIVYVN
ncbi:MAG TPA: peptidoglycan-associated lipoprotein Pal [Steroidobacteraceae bacterium]|nr:peptidoglycan-associated lipoprotein Pal [Steroidobacteraceae bacterium]